MCYELTQDAVVQLKRSLEYGEGSVSRADAIRRLSNAGELPVMDPQRGSMIVDAEVERIEGEFTVTSITHKVAIDCDQCGAVDGVSCWTTNGFEYSTTKTCAVCDNTIYHDSSL
jgi:hypothetical protein